MNSDPEVGIDSVLGGATFWLQFDFTNADPVRHSPPPLSISSSSCLLAVPLLSAADAQPFVTLGTLMFPSERVD